MLIIIAWLSIGFAVVSALWIAADEIRHPQPMAIMNIVWPVTALYFSLFAVVAYYRLGRPKAIQAGLMDHDDSPRHQGSMHPHDATTSAQRYPSPTFSQIAVGTSHCGAGCMIADLFSEFGIALAGLTLFGSVLWAEFAVDLAAAWILGILFQYAAIRPMRQSTAGRALVAAIQADTLSILAFQVGMYLWMALVYYRLFPHPHLNPFQPQYWLMMQIAMICGYATAFPMNWLLIRSGVKEAM